MCHAFLLSFILTCFIGFVFLLYNLRYSNYIRIQTEIPRFYGKNTIWVSCLFSFVLFKIFFFIGKLHVHPMGLEPMTLLLPCS